MGCVYVWLFGVQTFFALETRNIARKMPVVKNIPVQLPDSTVSLAPGTKLSYLGYEFEVPWDDIDETKTRMIGGNKAVIAFRSGNALSVWSGSPRDFVSHLPSTGVDVNAYRQMYGAEALQSDYSFHRMMFEATPNKITPFVSRQQAISQAMLILQKGICAPRGADSGIFEVRAGDFEGFQFGRPQSAQTGLSVELYSDTASLDFIFGQKASGSVVISQPDVNRILVTLHKVPSETLALNPTH